VSSRVGTAAIVCCAEMGVISVIDMAVSPSVL
jgi:hypothetical protein